MRTLRWFVGGSLSKASEGLNGAGMGEQHRLDQDGTPVALRLYMSVAPRGSPTVLDILDDGVCLFTYRPQMDADGLYKEVTVFAETGKARIAKASIVTLSLYSEGSKGAGRDLTVELDLE